MDYNRNLIANIYYKASNSLTIIAFTYFVRNSDFFLNNYFLSLAISAYASTLILINFFEDKDIGSTEHENLLTNLSLLTLILVTLSIFLNKDLLIYGSITFLIILKSLSDSFVAKKNQIVWRSFKLFFFDFLKILLLIFHESFEGSQLLMLLLLLSACPDIKIGKPTTIKLKNKGVFLKNILSLSKNLEAVTIFLFVDNGILRASSMIYIQQAVSAINVFLMTKWQKNIHQQGDYIKQYISDTSKHIIILSISLGFFGIIININELLMLATLIILRTIIIDPNLFMTNKFIRETISFSYVGIFLAGLLTLYFKEISIYYFLTLFLIIHSVRKISK